MRSRRKYSLLAIVVLLSVPLLPLQMQIPAAAKPQNEEYQKIEAAVLETLETQDETEFFVWMTEKADLSPAYSLETKEEKGFFVYNTLRQTAERSQKEIRTQLDQLNLDYRPFYIANKILVRNANRSVLFELASRRDVSRITANHTIQLLEPPGAANRAFSEWEPGTESNISFVNADDVWSMGITGQGTVLAGNDTGLDVTHPAIAPHYRGCLNPPDCTSWDHNYNWWDATGTYTTAPGDGYGHGVHITGIMVGNDGGDNKIGVAPGALTIHCKNMLDQSPWGTVASHSECFEWDLAPWDLSYTGPGTGNPRPDLAPDVVNNSWGDRSGDRYEFQDEVAALQAAGILVEASAGNSGSTSECGSLDSPGDYADVLSIGAIDHSVLFPGTLENWSSRGPSAVSTGYYPQVVAPGTVRSANSTLGYSVFRGTSQAGPHVSGLVGLLWSACPALRGHITETTSIITSTAAPLTGQSPNSPPCGGDYTVGPNHEWGWGTIDALAAVDHALTTCTDTGLLTGTVTDANTSTPISDTTILATSSPSQTRQTQTNVNGVFSMTLLSGLYDLTAIRYGYQISTSSSIDITAQKINTQNLQLTPASVYTLSGRVADANTSLPLYTQISIQDQPVDPVWTDPGTGHYSITLANGFTLTVLAQTQDPAYHPASHLLAPPTQDVQLDFDLIPENTFGCPPGYHNPFLFFDGFESGELAADWTVTTTNEGRVQVNDSDPYEGVHSVFLDDHTNGSSYSLAELILTQDLASETQLFLGFWWRGYGNRAHDQDGIFISDDQGVSWCKVFPFDLGPAEYTHETVDLAAALPGCGMSFTEEFQIKFQFADNSSVPADGYTLDAVRLGRVEDDKCAPIVPPSASFSSTTPVPIHSPVIFTNTTSLGWPLETSYLWDFGDVTSSTSSLENPTWLYSNWGTFSVTLEACNTTGCDEFNDLVQVTPVRLYLPMIHK